MSMQNECDIMLLRRYAAQRTEQDFTELVRRNIAAVYSSALRRVGGDSHLAKDVAQEVFVTLARRAESLSQYDLLTGWLYTATRNAAANRVRSEIRRRRREQEAQIMHEIISNDGHVAAWKQVAPVLEAAIDRLSQSDRLAVLLRFFERRTFAEIGTFLRISEDAARMRVDRALGKLRTQLARRGIHSSAIMLSAVMAEHTIGAAPSTLVAGISHSAQMTAASSDWLMRLIDLARSFHPVEQAIVAGSIAVMTAALGTGLAAARKDQSTDSLAAVANASRSALEARLAESEAQSKTHFRRSIILGSAIASAESEIKLRVSAINSSGSGPRRENPTLRSAGGRRTELSATYEPLYRSLRLTPAQIKQFETLGVQLPGSALWLFDRPVSREAALVPLSPTEVDDQLRALLGENGFAEYQEFNRAVPARSLVAQLARAIYLTEPLRSDQAEQLTQLLANTSHAYRNGGNAEPGTIDWDAALATASTVLRPGQVAALAGVRDQSVFQEALRKRLTLAASTGAASIR